MSTLKDYKDYQGQDTDLKISLFEYGLICKHVTKDYPDEYHVIAKIRTNPDIFDSGYFRESELNNLMLGQDWASQGDIAGVLSCVGLDLNEWLKLSFISKLSDLVGYFSIENFISPSRGTFEITEVE